MSFLEFPILITRKLNTKANARLTCIPARNQAEGAGRAPDRPGGLALWHPAHTTEMQDVFGHHKTR